MQHHAERMARLKQLMKQLDHMHRQVVDVARQVADLHRAEDRGTPRPAKRAKAGAVGGSRTKKRRTPRSRG